MISGSGIYEIKNNANGKLYIGSACCFSSRFAMHKHTLKNNNHHSIKLQRAWNKYGESSFSFNPILKCDVDNLLMYEQIIIDNYRAVDVGYNVARIAGSRKGVLATHETKEKISKSLIGNSYRLGKPHSDESKQKMKLAAKNKDSLSAETRIKIGLAHKGKTVSRETKIKMSETRLGRIQKNSTSGMKGIYWTKSKNKWKAVINMDGYIKFIGYFNDINSASNAILGVKNEML